MIFDINAHLDYAVGHTTHVLLQLEAVNDAKQSVVEEHLDLHGSDELARVAAEDGVGERLWVLGEERLICDYKARVEVTRPVADIASLDMVPLHHLPGETIKYLMDSRYCAATEFQSFVNAEFSSTEGGARVAALRQWIEQHFDYSPGASNAMTTALDTFVQRRGICRDFAHVLIALVRASGIPARIASVYALGIEPEDFHAVAEVHLDGKWHLIDPTGMATPDRMVRIGVGRDAADIAFMTSYGSATLNAQSVSVRQIAA